MMNVAQLSENIDSMEHKHVLNISDISRYMKPYLSIYQNTKADSLLFQKLAKGNITVGHTYKRTFLDRIPDSMRTKTAAITETNLRNVARLIGIVANDSDLQTTKINQFKIVWHKKFTLSFACMLLFLIGAPLGAIIRKGGLGMPVIIAIGFFIVYFIISSTGEKLATQGAVAPWYGMWLATGILLPIALVIMIAARNDSSIFNKEWYLRGWLKIKRLFSKSVFGNE
jgi:lipopolysaccharide export system permease protein